MSTTISPEALTAWFTPRLETFITELSALCAIECPSDSKAGVDEAGAWVRRWVATRGWEIQTFPDAQAGDNLVCNLYGSGTLRVMLVAHLDTVYPLGVAATRPLRREQGKLIGPGSADNKSGLLAGLYAMEALATLDSACFATLSLVCGSDEETDARSSGTLLNRLAPGYDLALVLEAARENGDIVSARKGNGLFTLDVHGRAAHAGVEPERGASAVLALAHQIIAIQALNGRWPGVTLNVGVISGGSVTNAVPDTASAQVDLRIVAPGQAAEVEAAIRAITDQGYVAGTHTTLSVDWGFPPMDRTPAIARLASLAQRCAHDLGFEVAEAATGGVSYANLLAGAGLPVLDGLGPVGGNDHSPAEYIDEAAIVPRTALLALLIARAGAA